MKFFKEFKEFITRGNVLDMAVGIIIGGAFTAIVTALVNNILNPLINMIVGNDGTSALQVVLREAFYREVEGGDPVLVPAVILDFGAVITAIVTFLLTALVLFIIIKAINGVRRRAEAAKEAAKKKEEEAKAAEAAAPVEEAPAPAAPTEAELLAEIRDLLKAHNSDKE